MRRVVQLLGCLLLLDTLVLLCFGQLNTGIMLPGLAGSWLLASTLPALQSWWQAAGWRRSLWRLTWTGFWLWLVSLIAFCVILLRAAAQPLPQQPAAIIVLGAGLRGEKPSLLLQYRLQRSRELALRYPATPLVVSGGQGLGETRRESDAMADYLQQHGISPARILRETQSTSTEENLAFSRQLLKQHGVDVQRQAILVVTSDFHLWRSERIARKQGYAQPAVAPSHTPWSIRLNAWLREHLACISGWVLGEY